MEHPVNRRYEIWQPLLMALILALGMLIGSKIDDELPLVAKASISSEHEPWDELKNVVSFIESRYGDSLDIDTISEEAIKLLVSKLDPHSYYLSGLEYLGFKEKMEGSYIGIGIDYDMINDTIHLIRIVPDSPAEKAGLSQGDQILDINGSQVSGIQISRSRAYEIWKESEKTIDLKIRTFKNHEVVTKKITKGPVRLPSVPVSLMLDADIGYIKINRFASDTYKDFMSRLEELKEKGLQNLIIDVRRNPGGSLDQVVKILNQLVPEKGQLLLYTEGLHTKKVEYKSTGKVFFPLHEIMVLIDEHSVSASEVLAGSLQDLGRATVVGRRSFGKGLVQEMYSLSPHSAINLTVAKYFLPSGRYIQKSYKDRESYDNELKIRISNGELFHQDSVRFTNHRKAKGLDGKMRPFGEGIVPDIFVPADSFYYAEGWQQLEKPIYQDAFKFFIERHAIIGDALESDHLDDLKTEILQQPVFTEWEQSDSLLPREKILEGYIHLLKWHFYGEDKYYEVMLKEDDDVQAALNAMSSTIQ